MCVFCKIINGEIPSYKIYEDENVYAFLDIADDIKGHTVVVPKFHCENLLDVSGEVLTFLMLAVKKIGKHYVENCGFDGFNILNNSGKSAEQSVFHLHIHIMPRYEGDGVKVYPDLSKLDSDFYELREKLKLN